MLTKVLIADLAGAALIAGILNLDRQAFGQFMLGRPLVAGFLTGLFWRELSLGLWLGMWAELWWSGQPPLGGQATPNGTLGVAAVTTGLAAASAWGWLGPKGLAADRELTAAALGGGLLAPVSYLAAQMERLHRRWAETMSGFLNDRERAGAGPKHRLRYQIIAAGWTAASGAAFIFIASWAVALLGAGLINIMPDSVSAGLALAPPFLSLLGMAVMIGSAPRLSALPFYGAGLLASLLTITSFMP